MTQCTLLSSFFCSRHDGSLTSSTYIDTAMDIFRQKYGTNSTTVLFIMASDDLKWCQEKFSRHADVVFTSSFESKFSEKQPTFDLAVLTQCNHSILRFVFLEWKPFHSTVLFSMHKYYLI